MHERKHQVAFLLVALLLPVGCGDDAAGPVVGEPAEIVVSPDTAMLHAVGDTVQFTAVVRDRWGDEVTGVTVAWTVADTLVAAIDDAGRLVSRSAGVTHVTAAVDTLEGMSLARIDQIPASLTVSPAADTLAEGASGQLSAVVADSNGVAIRDAVVSWTTSDPAVATVDTAGVVTAETWSADATITATGEGLSDSAAIHALGQIAFRTRRDGDWEIFIMHADGGGLTRLTDNAAWDRLPVWSPDGSQIAFASKRDGNFEVYVVNADGSGRTNLSNHPASDDRPVWSPDGTEIAFVSTRDGNWDVYVMNADGTGQAPLTSDTLADAVAAWSPDGSTIAFHSDRDGDWEIYITNADGGGQTKLTTNMVYDVDPAWSPDGNRILFERLHDPDAFRSDLYVIDADGSGSINLTADSSSWDVDPAWSPDGSKIAFKSDRDGAYDVYIMNADGTGIANLTGPDGADGPPAWSPDGSKLAFTTYRDGNGEIYIMNPDGSSPTRLTIDGADDRDPVWRPRP